MVSRKGVKLRPTVEREKLYRLVVDLRKEGLSYGRIIKEVETRCGVTLNKSNISGWVNQKHEPFGYVRAFEGVLSSELAYVTGVSLGDGSTSSNRNHDHMIKLRVIDRDFALEFARCLGILLGRNPPPVTWHEKTQSWWTQVASLLLQRFLRQELRALILIMSHCDDCKGAFIRGFFDSEGNMFGRSLTASNEDLELLECVCELLHSLGVETTGTHLASRGGRTVSIKGKLYRQNQDCHRLYVRAKSLEIFDAKVGFSIVRKSAALSLAIGKRR